MIRFAILLCSVLTASSISNDNQDPEGFIVGGNNAGTNSFLFMIQVRSNGYYICGGALISQRWVISAAQPTRNLLPSLTNVTYGSHTQTSRITIRVSRIIVHPDFNPRNMDADLSLLETSVNAVTRVQAIRLPSTPLVEGVTVTKVGFGLTANGGFASTLQWLNSATIPNAFCRTRFNQNLSNQVRVGHVCTISTVRQGMCIGDEGSPVVLGSLLVAIHSWSIPCGTDTPDVHTRIEPYREWIRTVAGV